MTRSIIWKRVMHSWRGVSFKSALSANLRKAIVPTCSAARLLAFAVVLIVSACKEQPSTVSGLSAPRLIDATSATEADCAAALIREMKSAGETRAMTYDAAISQIALGADGAISTTHICRVWRELPPTDRDGALRRFLMASVPPQGDSFEQVSAQLLPEVQPSSYFELLTLSPSEGQLPHVVVADAIGISAVIDQPTSMQAVTARDLQKWHTSLEDVLAISVKNLRARKSDFRQRSPGVWGVEDADYASGHLTLIEEIDKLKLVGGAVALLPHRGLLLLCGASDAKALLTMARLATEAAEDPLRPIHTIALCRSAAEWVACVPNITSEVRERYHALALDGWQSLYNGQRTPLQRRVGTSVAVAPFRVFEQNDTRLRASYATWTRGESTLLPKTEYVAFVDPAKPGRRRFAKWDAMMNVCGLQLQPDGRSPKRWATGQYPSEAELNRMQASQDPFSPQRGTY